MVTKVRSLTHQYNKGELSYSEYVDRMNTTYAGYWNVKEIDRITAAIFNSPANPAYKGAAPEWESVEQIERRGRMAQQVYVSGGKLKSEYKQLMENK